jgi:outer membrane lipopolysaccharide assembly protein LptE/RlpB
MTMNQAIKRSLTTAAAALALLLAAGCGHLRAMHDINNPYPAGAAK